MAKVTEIALVLGDGVGKPWGGRLAPSLHLTKEGTAWVRPAWDTLQLDGQNTAMDTT